MQITFAHAVSRIAILGIALLVVPSAEVAAQVPDVLYLRFEEGAGLSTFDWANPGTHTAGTLIGGCALTTGTAPLGQGSLITGQSTGDGVLFPNLTAPASTSFTIEFWAKILPTGFGGLAYICGNACSSLSLPGSLGVGLSFTSLTTIVSLTSCSGVYAISGPTAGLIGTWMHVAIVADSAAQQIRFYQNGLLVSSQSATTFCSLNSYFSAYGLLVGGAFPATCTIHPTQPSVEIDEFRIWSTARTGMEILANYTNDLGSLFATHVGTDPAAPITFNPSSGTFAASATVTEIGYTSAPFGVPQGFLPTGTTISFTGSYSGSDLALLSNITFNAATLRITAAAGSDELLIQGAPSLAGVQPTHARFLGQSAIVARVRPAGTVLPPVVTRIGGGTPMLDDLAAAYVAAPNWGVLVESSLFGHRLRAVTTDLLAPPVPPESRFGTDGAGSVFIGDIGMPAAARLHHIFAVSPSIAPGTGPVFGLELTPFVFEQFQLPFPVRPFYVAADGAGAYSFVAGPGSLPPGFVVDMVSVTLAPPAFTTVSSISPALRVTF